MPAKKKTATAAPAAQQAQQTTIEGMSFFTKELGAAEGIRDKRDAGFALSIIEENVRNMNKTRSAREQLRRKEIGVLVVALRRYIRHTRFVSPLLASASVRDGGSPGC
ncbi:hypothetical protein [Candidatus Poriferisodalis sp.]|uniref:hypothetical protein n=1 Tax=Candidatus Poriferisodalis sp. TaxID=3101277 RepID=UPI003B02E6F8